MPYSFHAVPQDRALGDSRLYSGILGASVANLSIKSLQEDVVITLRNTEAVPVSQTNTHCIYLVKTFSLCQGWDILRSI